MRVDSRVLDHGQVLHVCSLAGREREARVGDAAQGSVKHVAGLAVGLFLGLVVRTDLLYVGYMR